MTPEQEERRGEEARRVLESAIYTEAYRVIEQNIITQMAQQATPADKAEDLRKLLIAHRKVRIYMEQVLTTGNMVAEQEERKRRLSDIWRRRA